MTPEYRETVEIAKAGLRLAGGKPAAFGRFTGRKKTTYSWNELVIKMWLDKHGIEYSHNQTFKDDAPSGFGRKMVTYEADFYCPRFSAIVEVDPLFHYKSGNEVTRRVMQNDDAKNRWAKEHGIHMIRVVAYPKPEDFAAEILQKLGPLARY